MLHIAKAICYNSILLLQEHAANTRRDGSERSKSQNGAGNARRRDPNAETTQRLNPFPCRKLHYDGQRLLSTNQEVGWRGQLLGWYSEALVEEWEEVGGLAHSASAAAAATPEKAKLSKYVLASLQWSRLGDKQVERIAARDHMVLYVCGEYGNICPWKFVETNDPESFSLLRYTRRGKQDMLVKRSIKASLAARIEWALFVLQGCLYNYRNLWTHVFGLTL